MFCSFTDIRDLFGRYDFQKKKNQPDEYQE